MTSQDNFSRERLERFTNLRKIKNLVEAGKQAVYLYGSLAVKEQFEERKRASKIPIFHAEYMPDFTEYQYDLEMFIFLNYDELYKRELELASGPKLKLLEHKGKEWGATFLKREEHLQNAMLIRFPEKILPTGEASTAYALTPWARDFVFGVSNYQNVVMFGGGGQGKTFSPIVFMTMMYDHFIQTKSGAQCSFSTVSETKLKTSIWSHLNKVYSYKNPYKFSKYAGLAHAAPEYTFRRKNDKGKYIEEGGTMKGILLVQGAKTAKQIDKLTGQHDVMARLYLLDEAQSTGAAPLQAYNNMFLHPRYAWMFMCGNYELDEDLLGINTIPDTPNGWSDVDEKTHMWESSLKSPDSDLGHKSLVIHYNNDLSPAIVGKHAEELKRKYSKFLPTIEKKRKLYKTKADSETYEAKRFWVGFRFEKEKDNEEKVMTIELLKMHGAHEKQNFKTLFTASSFDPAHSFERDRNIITIFNIGLNDKQMPMFAIDKPYALKNPVSALTYIKESSAQIKEIHDKNGVESGQSILDWTQRSGHVEELNKLGIVFHHLIYSQKPPCVVGINEVTKITERPVEIDTVKTFSAGFIKEVKTYAHEMIANRITLGAYAFRIYVEAGMFKNINANIFNTIPTSKTFEEEICMRVFEWDQRHTREPKLKLDDKDQFKRKRRFSPDVLDTIFQFCYMAWVIFGIRPNQPGLGNLKKKVEQKVIDNSRWDAKLRFRNSHALSSRR
jgi:hypothetical protein